MAGAVVLLIATRTKAFSREFDVAPTATTTKHKQSTETYRITDFLFQNPFVFIVVATASEKSRKQDRRQVRIAKIGKW